jgi:hypothetical protein
VLLDEVHQLREILYIRRHGVTLVYVGVIEDFASVRKWGQTSGLQKDVTNLVVGGSLTQRAKVQ